MSGVGELFNKMVKHREDGIWKKLGRGEGVTLSCVWEKSIQERRGSKRKGFEPGGKVSY